MAYNKRILSEIDRELKDRYRSKRYSKSLAATNSLFAVNDLFAKPSRRRIYNPNAQYFQGGGAHDPSEKSKSLDEVTVTGSRKDPPSKYYDKDGTLIEDIPSYGTIYTSDPNDPRIQEFKEKMRFYNLSKNHYLNMLIDEQKDWIEEHKKSIEFWKKEDPSQIKEVEDLIRDAKKNIANYSGKDYIKHYRYQGPKGGYKVGDDLFDDVLAGKYDKDKKYEGLESYNTLDDDNLRILKEGLKLGHKPRINNIGEGYVNVEYPYPSLTIKYADPEKYDWAKPVEEEPEIEIEKLDVIQPEFLSNDAELPELVERDEVEGVDYKRKFGMWLEDKAQKDAKLKTFFKYAVPEFFNDKPSRVSQYYRTPKRIRAGFYNEPIEQEQLYPEGFIANMKFQKGGPINTSGPRAEGTSVDEDAMNAMMKARLAYEEMHGNPAAKRMVASVDNPYDFGDGRTGTHYMSSYDNYAIPEIQDVDGTLEMTGPRDNEAIRFDREEDARYFANENYKRVSPMFINAELDDKEIQKYVDGGYIVEEMAEGGDVDVKCPPGKAWNGKYCAKIQIVTEDGKKIKVVPSAYEMDNPTDSEYAPYGIELQRLSDIDKLYEYQDKYGWDDEMTNKKICGDAGCHSVLIDDDTEIEDIEIEDIEPVKKRRPIEDIYPEVDHDKYPTIEDFIFAADYYKENGEDPSDDLLPSNRVEEEPEEEPKIEELDVEPLPVIEPEPIINVTPDPIIDDRTREDEIIEEDIEDELPSAEEFYADSLPVTNSEGEIVLPYEETTGKYRKERRGTRRPGTKNRSWDGIKGNLQRIFTDKEYSGPWFPGLKRRIKQEGGVPEFQKGGKVAKKLVATANDIKGDMLLHAVSPLAYLSEIRPNLSSLVPRFGLTKSLKDKFQLEQNLAANDASNFVNDWFYKPDKIIRPEVAGRIRDIYKEELSPEQFNQRKSFKTRLDNGEVDKWGVDKFVDGEQVITNPDLLESMLTLDQSTRYLDHPENKLANARNLLVGTNSNDILGNSNLNDRQKAYLLRKRFVIGGVNFGGSPSVTLNNMGSFYLSPNRIANTAVHEGGHTGQDLSDWADIMQTYDPNKSKFYRPKSEGPGKYFKKVLWKTASENPVPNPLSSLFDTDYYGSINELHSELMVGRFKVANEMAEAQMKKDGFTSKKYDDFQLRGLRKDYRVKAIEDLQNPSEEQIKKLIKAGTLNKHFRPGAKKADKYKAIRMLPGVGAAFALPSLMGDDDKPKLQKGGVLELGDEVTEDMVEELRRQGYTIEEI